MSDRLEPAGPAQQPKQDPEALALRGRPRPAVRFRRGLIVGLSGAVAASLITLSWLALEPPSFRTATNAVESEEPERTGGDDALASVPSNYGDVPRLGPPLPGDLGRPILERQGSLEAAPSGALESSEAQRSAAAAEIERERLAAAKEAARSSNVLVQLATASGSGATGVQSLRPEASASEESPQSVVRPEQQHKIDFARSGNGDTSSQVLRGPPSAWTLSAGTIVPASLITGLNSDLPGTVLAQVTENVRDSATGRTVLIPQGARLIGRYDSVVAYGQRRALLLWTRIVFPDGSSIGLDNVPATDAAGYAGIADRVDLHSWQRLKGIGLSTLLGVGTQLSLGGSESDLVRAIRESTQQNAAHAGDQMTSRNLDIQPTISVRPGWPVRAVVNKDLVLRPWRG